MMAVWNEVQASDILRRHKGRDGALLPILHDVQAAFGHRSYVLEDVLFSMMAHISYDLPIALQRMAPVATHVAKVMKGKFIRGEKVDVRVIK